MKKYHTVTGAFGYSGSYIAEKLLESGLSVKTLTSKPGRNHPLNDKVISSPFNFDSPHKLTEFLKDTEVLYNTYWVRFNHASFTHSDAVENTLTLFRCAKEAGVKRIVHVSITNPSLDSELEYFHGKAVLEKALVESGVSYSILRPAVLFGKEDILMNNIAWMIRKFPLFGVFGNGEYRIQPVFVEDLAKLAIEQGQSKENITIDAVGPETYSYKDLAREIMMAIGIKRKIITISPAAGLIFSRIVGFLKSDVTLTKAEIEGLSSDLLCTDSEPSCSTRFSEWAAENSDNLGKNYASELARRRNV